MTDTLLVEGDATNAKLKAAALAQSLLLDHGTYLIEAIKVVAKDQKASTSYLQRSLAIGHNRAHRLIDAMEELGYITDADSVGHREVLINELPPTIQNAMKANEIAGKAPSPMKNTPADREVSDRAYRVTADELRQFIERWEHLDAEKKEIADQQMEVMAEAKARGYDTKIIRKVIALRKRDADDVAEEEAVLEMYKEALGMR